jgi:hypothetical protein
MPGAGTGSWPGGWGTVLELMRVNSQAGEQWISDFIKRNNGVVSLRKSQGTSLTRTTAFNRLVTSPPFSIYLCTKYRKIVSCETNERWSSASTLRQYIPLFLQDNPDKFCAKAGHAAKTMSHYPFPRCNDNHSRIFYSFLRTNRLWLCNALFTAIMTEIRLRRRWK